MLCMAYFTSKSSFSFANTMPMGGLLFAEDKNYVLIYPKSLVIRHSVTNSISEKASHLLETPACLDMFKVGSSW